MENLKAEAYRAIIEYKDLVEQLSIQVKCHNEGELDFSNNELSVWSKEFETMNKKLSSIVAYALASKDRDFIDYVFTIDDFDFDKAFSSVGGDILVADENIISCTGKIEKVKQMLKERVIYELHNRELIVNTEAEKRYFERALKIGYMKQTDSGFEWMFGGNKGQVRLGYYCSLVYSVPRPINDIERLFGVKKISSSITQAETNKKNIKKRRDVAEWIEEMDKKLFFD